MTANTLLRFDKGKQMNCYHTVTTLRSSAAILGSHSCGFVEQQFGWWSRLESRDKARTQGKSKLCCQRVLYILKLNNRLQILWINVDYWRISYQYKKGINWFTKSMPQFKQFDDAVRHKVTTRRIMLVQIACIYSHGSLEQLMADSQSWQSFTLLIWLYKLYGFDNNEAVFLLWQNCPFSVTGSRKWSVSQISLA